MIFGTQKKQRTSGECTKNFSKGILINEKN